MLKPTGETRILLDAYLAELVGFRFRSDLLPGCWIGWGFRQRAGGQLVLVAVMVSDAYIDL